MSTAEIILWLKWAFALWCTVTGVRWVFPRELAPKPSTTKSRALNMGLCVALALFAAWHRATPFIGEPTTTGYVFAGLTLGTGVTFAHKGLSRFFRALFGALQKRALSKAGKDSADD